MSAFRLVAMLGAALLAGACSTTGPSLTGADEPSGLAAGEPPAEPPPAMAASPGAGASAQRLPPAQQQRTAARPPAAERPPAARSSAPPAAAQQAARPASAPAGTGGAMAGSWQFSDGKQACVMTLAGGATGGSVSAAGNCWSSYSAAKSWRVQGNEMVLTDANNRPIARMQSTDTSRYDGYGADGEPVVLVK